MKVVSEAIALSILESCERDAKLMVRMLENSMKYNFGHNTDLEAAKRHLLYIEGRIKCLKECAWDTDEIISANKGIA